MVDFAQPDFAYFPGSPKRCVTRRSPSWTRRRDVHSRMWWHHVEALEAFNVLVNYWWRRSPAFMDSPMNALMLAILTVRDLPPEQREAWQKLFRHYVFEADDARPATFRRKPAASSGRSMPKRRASCAHDCCRD